jgi:uncharacterized protein involved in response to NO
MSPPAPQRVVFALGFRPFFLAVGVEGVALMLAWLGMLHGVLPAPRWLDPFVWHGHEMLFGLVGAAIAGFLTTAVPSWTATPQLAGARLAGFFGLWVIGRAALSLASQLRPLAVAAADLAFPLALLAAVVWPIARARAARQLGIVVVLALLVAANAVVHLDALGVAPGAARPALRIAMVGVGVLILVIGGRITPAFTRNAMQRVGAAGEVRASPWLDRCAVAGAFALALAEVLAPRSLASGAAAAVAALAAAGRMTCWQTRFALGDPLLASLHAGHAWVAAGFAAIALSDLGAPIPPTVALHALGAGAAGVMILAVTTRVALGHTGRPLVAPRSARLAYLLVNAGALARVLGPLLAPGHLVFAWTLAGGLWAAAFVAFLAGYARLLVTPRVDGRPG